MTTIAEELHKPRLYRPEDLRVTFTVSRAAESPFGFVIDGDIRDEGRLNEEDEGENEDGVSFGHVSALWAPSFDSWSEVEDLADSESDDAYRLASPRVFDSFAAKYADYELIDAWLGVLVIKIDETQRKRQLSYHVMRELLAAFGNGYTLVTCLPHPLLGRSTQVGSDTLVEYPTAGEVLASRPGQKRLQDHWRRFGFRRARATGGVYYHYMPYRWPRGSWMRVRGGAMALEGL